MKVQAILDEAIKCVNDEECLALVGKIEAEFEKVDYLKYLQTANSEAYLEGEDGPHIRFELNKVLSGKNIICVAPYIREGEFRLRSSINHMKDGLGMNSKSWEVDYDSEEDEEVSEDKTIEQVAQRVKELIIDQHAYLLQSVGLTKENALTAARKEWD